MKGQGLNPMAGNYIKRIRMIYFILVGGILLVSTASFLLIYYRVMGTEDNRLAMEWLRILLFVIPISMATGYITFRIRLKEILPVQTLEHKLKKYYVAALLRMIFFGIPGLLLSVAAWASSQFLFLVIVPFILLVFLLARPFRTVIAEELKLPPHERLMLEKIEG